MADRNANIIVTLRSNADAEARKLASSFREMIQQARDAGASQEQAERKALSHAQALARLAVASGQAAQGERVLAAALSQVNRESLSATRAQTQLATIQAQTAAAARRDMDALRGSLQPIAPALQQNANAAQQFGGALRGSLLSILGPAALATAALGGVAAVTRSFGDAFNFKVQLDATNQSIANQLAGVRDSGRVFEEARRFGERYRITQAETSAILQNSVGILRASTTSVADLESTLIRLQSRNPAKPISEAARALRELNTGDVTTIKDLFDVGAADALRMKNEIAGGADAVQVLSRYLTDAGNGMEVLEQRTRGAMGAINARAQAEERLQLAQAAFAEGPGVRLLQLQTDLTNGLTTALTLNGAAFREANAAMAAKGAAAVAYNEAIRNGATEQQAQTAATQAYADKARELEPIQNAVARALAATSDAATALHPVLSTLAEAHGAAGAAADVQAVAEGRLAGQIDGVRRQAITAGSALAAMRGLQAEAAKAEQDANAKGINQVASRFGRGAGSGAAEQAERERKARVQLALAQATSDAQRLAILKQQLATTTDTVERLQLQTQIAGLQQSAAKSHTKELNTQLGLEERIADSKEKQLRSAIDASLALNDDAKQDILDADRLRRNQNTIANAKDPRIRALAQLDSDRVPLEDARRALDIREQLATAGGQLANGRILQGDRAGGLPGGLPALPGLSGGVGLPGGNVTNVYVYLDKQEIAAEVVVELQGGLNAVRSAGAGRN